MAKILEFITPFHMQLLLKEMGVPIITHTAFRKHNSSEDAVFASLEAMTHEDQAVCF